MDGPNTKEPAAIHFEIETGTRTGRGRWIVHHLVDDTNFLIVASQYGLPESQIANAKCFRHLSALALSRISCATDVWVT